MLSWQSPWWRCVTLAAFIIGHTSFLWNHIFSVKLLLDLALEMIMQDSTYIYEIKSLLTCKEGSFSIHDCNQNMKFSQNWSDFIINAVIIISRPTLAYSLFNRTRQGFLILYLLEKSAYTYFPIGAYFFSRACIKRPISGPNEATEMVHLSKFTGSIKRKWLQDPKALIFHGSLLLDSLLSSKYSI